MRAVPDRPISAGRRSCPASRIGRVRGTVGPAARPGACGCSRRHPSAFRNRARPQSAREAPRGHGRSRRRRGRRGAAGSRPPDGRETPVSPTTLLTVYASNETLCFRAKGLTDRQLRRHLETLDAAGLIRRRDSANGKRFPVMQHGKPIGAFGLDLSPLFAQSDELLALALRRREEADELRGLRAQILRLRAACAELQLSDAVATFIDGLRNLVRRTSLTFTEARAALSKLNAVLSSHAAPQAAAVCDAEQVEQHLPSSAEPADPASLTETTANSNTIEETPENFRSLAAETCNIAPTNKMPGSADGMSAT